MSLCRLKQWPVAVLRLTVAILVVVVICFLPSLLSSKGPRHSSGTKTRSAVERDAVIAHQLRDVWSREVRSDNINHVNWKGGPSSPPHRTVMSSRVGPPNEHAFSAEEFGEIPNSVESLRESPPPGSIAGHFLHRASAFGDLVNTTVTESGISIHLPDFAARLLQVFETSVQHKMQKQMPIDDETSVRNYLRNFKSPYILADDVEVVLQTARAEQNSPEYQRLHPEDKSVARIISQNTKTVAWYEPGTFRQSYFQKDAFDLCPVSNCKAIPPAERNLADAVLFRGVDGREKPPPRSNPQQIYVLYDMEPAIHVSGRYWTDEWNNVFNWTWTFRRDSEIWEPIAYLKLAKSVPSQTHLRAVTDRKTRAAAWFVSNCHPVSRRDEYVQALREHGLVVDIYGECGNLSCPKTDRSACFDMLTKRYYFYLSFENAFCRDYITEKLFNKFQQEIHALPIVLGGVDYSRFFPQGTYIDVSWFRHPKDLANYLKTLMTDPDRYTHLLWRKAHFDLADRGAPLAVCELCRRLHDLHTYGKWYNDLRTWRFHDQCFPPPSF